MLDIDAAIKHCLEVAEDNETKAQKIGVQFLGTTKDKEATDCAECAADHRQLAEWLMELKDLRAEQNDQYVYIRELMDELKEAKRLLKAAVEDMNKEADCGICLHDNDSECPIKVIACKFKWRHAAEALALIGEDGEQNDD